MYNGRGEERRWSYLVSPNIYIFGGYNKKSKLVKALVPKRHFCKWSAASTNLNYSAISGNGLCVQLSRRIKELRGEVLSPEQSADDTKARMVAKLLTFGELEKNRVGLPAFPKMSRRTSQIWKYFVVAEDDPT